MSGSNQEETSYKHDDDNRVFNDRPCRTQICQCRRCATYTSQRKQSRARQHRIGVEVWKRASQIKEPVYRTYNCINNNTAIPGDLSKGNSDKYLNSIAGKKGKTYCQNWQCSQKLVSKRHITNLKRNSKNNKIEATQRKIFGDDLESEDMLCENCKTEFQKRVTLEHLPWEDFVISQYRRKCIIYPIYRSLIAAYCILLVVASGVINKDMYGPKILIWFTYWALYSLTVSSIVRCFTAWIYRIYWKDEEGRLYISWMPTMLKFQWLAFNISSTITTIICIIFWTSVFDPATGPTPVSINTHAVTLILILMDAFISRHPVRFLHFLQSTVFCIVYAIFTVIYWSQGGTNHLNQPYIYKILDYTGGTQSAICYILIVPLVAVPLCHSFHYFLYRSRTRIYQYVASRPECKEKEIGSKNSRKVENVMTQKVTTV